MSADSGSAQPGYLRSLRTVLHSRGYRRLLGTRLVSQASDGAFQVALTSLFLFSPERQPTTAAIAAALAASLLPYTLVGPFAGVLLDRWQRRQVLLTANLVRAVLVLGTAAVVAAGVVGPLLYAIVLACLSINRFFLAGLSAALPHVVPAEHLVMANAVTPTLGTTAVLAGGAAGYGARLLLGASDGSDAVVLVAAAGGYLGSAGVVCLLGRDRLGPEGVRDRSAVGVQLRRVAAGMAAGVQHLRERRAAAHALALVGVHRVGYGLLTIAALLLCRHRLTDPADVQAGLDLAALVLGASGVGFAVGAVATPWAVARVGIPSWVVGCLLAAAAVQGVLAVGVEVPALVAVAFVLGVTAQGLKVSVDSVVQASVDDAYRGRVFSLYDVVFNAAFVAAGLLAVAVVPADGYSPALYAGVAALYLLAAAAYRHGAGGPLRRPAPAAAPTS